MSIPGNLKRRIKRLNGLLDGFGGKLTTRKCANMTRSSISTDLRDIKNLIEHGALKQEPMAGDVRAMPSYWKIGTTYFERKK